MQFFGTRVTDVECSVLVCVARACIFHGTRLDWRLALYANVYSFERRPATASRSISHGRRPVGRLLGNSSRTVIRFAAIRVCGTPSAFGKYSIMSVVRTDTKRASPRRIRWWKFSKRTGVQWRIWESNVAIALTPSCLCLFQCRCHLLYFRNYKLSNIIYKTYYSRFINNRRIV